MKKILFIVLISGIVSSIQLQAQLLNKKESTVKLGNKNYKLTVFDKGTFVSNQGSDQYSNRKLPYNPSQLPMNGIAIEKTSGLISEQIRKTLPESRLLQFSKGNDILSMEIIFVPSGKIKHIIFNYSNNSLITLEEIDKLDEIIKKNVNVEIVEPELYKNIPYIVFMPKPIRFAKLYR